MRLQIIDLDNCISDDEWRIPAIDWHETNLMKRYHDYHMLGAFDQADNHGLFIGLPYDVRLFVFTARPKFFQANTVEWLRRNEVPCEVLFMRENDDMSPSCELKKKFMSAVFTKYRIKASEILAAYDDRKDVISTYKKMGVNGVIRSIHSADVETISHAIVKGNKYD